MTWSKNKNTKVPWRGTALLLVAAFLVAAMPANAAPPPGATQTLVNPTGNYYFGRMTDVDGNRMIVGDSSAAQKAFIYVRGANGWQLEATLTGPAGPYSGFGESVAIHGNIAAVAAYTTGVIRIYERDANGWSEKAQIVGAPGWGYGATVNPMDLSGNFLAVGDGVYGNYGSGSVRAFERVSATSWVQRAAVGAGPGQVYLSGTQLLVNAQQGYFCPNAWSVFEVSSSGLTLKQSIPCSTGTSLASVSGDYALASGKVFKRGSGGLWSMVATITPPAGNFWDSNQGISRDGVVAVSTYYSPVSMHLFRPAASGYALMDTIPGSWGWWSGVPKFSATDFMSMGATPPLGSGLNVFDFDTDGDDLAKWTELRIGTDWTKFDTDGDLWGDGQEYRCGTNPLDVLSFPTVACEGTLPGGLRLGKLLGPALDDAWNTVRGATSAQDADGDNIPDLAESRICGTAAVAGALATAGGAAGSCASTSNYVPPSAVPGNVPSAVKDAVKPVDDQLGGVNVGNLPDEVPDYVNVWNIPCSVEDTNTPADGTCTGSGGNQVYHPPSV